MWKKILSLTFLGSFIAVTSSNVVSCNVPKQQQLSFNLNDWKESWAFTTQGIWQGMGKGDSSFLLQESDGIFLNNEGNIVKLDANLFNKFQNTENHRSDRQVLETYFQLRYFVPSIIFFNEKPYDSALKSNESIQNNFDITYSSIGNEAKTQVINDLPIEKNLKPDQQGQVSELVWGTVQAGETLSAYINVNIALKNPHQTNDGKLVTDDGYYIHDDQGYQKEIKWTMGVYFSLSLF